MERLPPWGANRKREVWGWAEWAGEGVMELGRRAKATTVGVYGWGTPTRALGQDAATDTGPCHIYWQGAMVQPPTWG